MNLSKEVKEQILEMHCAGKKHRYIVRELEKKGINITKRDIINLIIEEGKGGICPPLDKPHCVACGRIVRGEHVVVNDLGDVAHPECWGGGGRGNTEESEGERGCTPLRKFRNFSSLV
jgi:hypothetical protein